MSKKNQNYTNRKQNRFQPERMRGNVFVNNSGKQWLPGENGRAAKVEMLLRGTKQEKKEIAGNMAGYKDSGVEWIGEIPEEWKVIPLKYITKCKDSQRIPIDVTKREHGRFPYWGAGGITDYVSSYIFDEELVLLGEDAAPFLDKKRDVAFLVNDKIWVNNHIHVLKANKNLNASYLRHCLNITQYEEFIFGSVIPKLTQTDMKKIPVTLPPLAEQQRIADFLDTKCGILDRTIDAVIRQIDDLEKYKKALITKTVTKGICKKGEPERAMKDSGVEWIGEVPEEWSIKPFKALAGMKGSSEYTARDIVDEGEGAILLSPSNINDNKLNLSKRTYISQKKYDKSTTKIHRGDLLFTKTASVGKCVIYDSDEPAMPNPQLVVLKNIKCLPKFLYYSMVSDVMQAPAKMYVYGSVIPTISQLNLGRIKIPVPSPEEQQQIADYLDEKCKNIDNRVQKRKQQLEWLKEYKKSLIFDYVTGKKRV